MDFNATQVDNYSNQIRYKIINSKIIDYPFPHSETNNILSNQLLDEIEKNFPDKNDFISSTQGKTVTVKKTFNNKHPYDFRNQIFLTKKDEISTIKGKKLNFWKFFTKIITSPLVIGSLLTLYNKYLLKRFGDSMKDMIFYPNLMLIHDKANYSLGPHTDISNKVIVILIYLASDNETNSTDSYGTSIYIPKEIGFTCEGDKHHKHKDFFKIYTSSFKKNNSFSFFRTNNSFHGVETISDKPIERKLLQYSIMAQQK
jgi:hypothetical protein